MKKIIASIFFLSFLNVSAQNSSFLSKNNILDGGLFYAKINSNSGKTLEYNEIKGSPYINKSFFEAKIADNYKNINARYNSYSDQIEYEEDEKIYILPKKDIFSKIEFINTKEVLLKLDTGDDFSGYFFEIVNGKNSLYKKMKTKFVDAVAAANSYSSDKPASFKTLEPVYYINTEKGFIKKPKNKKEILEQFPDKKDALEVFFKENKIKFDKEEDLKKLVTFLNK